MRSLYRARSWLLPMSLAISFAWAGWQGSPQRPRNATIHPSRQAGSAGTGHSLTARVRGQHLAAHKSVRMPRVDVTAAAKLSYLRERYVVALDDGLRVGVAYPGVKIAAICPVAPAAE
jgi:hypothetical protein